MRRKKQSLNVKRVFVFILGFLLISHLMTMNVNGSTDYQGQLRAAGFPESYLASLDAIHERHPNWNFEVLAIPFTFEHVVSQEYVPGRGINVVPRSYPVYEKSFDPKDYNFETNTWNIYDGWHPAGPSRVMYQLDPRGFLSDDLLFQFEDLTYNQEKHTREGIVKIFAGSFMAEGNDFDLGDGNRMQYVDAFMEAASLSNVSPFHLASRARQEVTVGSQPSGSVSGVHSDPALVGKYNFFNIGAFDQNGFNAVTNGLKYAAEKGWDNPYKSIVEGAQFISRNYIAVGQNTLFLQKFDIAVDGGNGFFRHQYMTNVFAPAEESKKIYNAYRNIGVLENSFIFKIPVYQQMPIAPSQKPGNAKNQNNWIQDITLDQGNIMPNFNPETYDYTIDFPAGVTQFTIGGTMFHNKAWLENTGTYEVLSEDQKLVLYGVSEDGQKRAYSFIIKGFGDITTEETENFEIASDIFNINDTWITGVDPVQAVNVADRFLNSVQVSADYTKKVFNKNNEELSGEALIGHGDTLHIYKEEQLVGHYLIVIYGDVDGNGQINENDVDRLLNVALNLEGLSDIDQLAADINKDGRITAFDANEVYKVVNGGHSLNQ